MHDHSFRHVVSKFPFAVELIVPENGLGRILDRVSAFHSIREIKQNATRDHDIFVWRFADVETAQTFTDQFGGSMLLPPSIL